MKINKEQIISILITIIVLFVIIGLTIMALYQISPNNLCKDKPDYYEIKSIKINNNYITCGELKAINTSI